MYIEIIYQQEIWCFQNNKIVVVVRKNSLQNCHPLLQRTSSKFIPIETILEDAFIDEILTRRETISSF